MATSEKFYEKTMLETSVDGRAGRLEVHQREQHGGTVGVECIECEVELAGLAADREVIQRLNYEIASKAIGVAQIVDKRQSYF